jgi:ABC-type taurine transport system substrate-binding protein
MLDFTRKFLDLARVLKDWSRAILDTTTARRERVARYAEAIAETLHRAGQAFTRLEADPADRQARREALRELARLAGYVEGIVAALDGHIDGRRTAGLKRRLEGLALEGLISQSIDKADTARIERLATAEGHFRALADGLRV